MQLTWYGTANLVLEEGDTKIAFDPFFGLPLHDTVNRDSDPLYEKEFADVKSIFVTHGHLDHIYHIPKLCRDHDITVYCTKTPLATLKKNGVPKDRLRQIAPGWQESIGPFHITAYQGRHCIFDMPLIMGKIFSPRIWNHFSRLLSLGRLNARYPERREILFYEVACMGKRIQIMGSMNLDDNTVYPTGADILILPFQGRSDQDEYALFFVNRLKPKRILLDHYDDAFPPLSETVDTSAFVENVQEFFDIPCQPLKKGETIYE